MNILYIHQYFKTPDEPGGTRSYWISKELVGRGHSVTVICSTNKQNPIPCTRSIEGIKVIYVRNEYNNYMSIPRKIYSFLNFIRLAIKEAKKQKKSRFGICYIYSIDCWIYRPKIKKENGLAVCI